MNEPKTEIKITENDLGNNSHEKVIETYEQPPMVLSQRVREITEPRLVKKIVESNGEIKVEDININTEVVYTNLWEPNMSTDCATKKDLEEGLAKLQAILESHPLISFAAAQPTQPIIPIPVTPSVPIPEPVSAKQTVLDNLEKEAKSLLANSSLVSTALYTIVGVELAVISYKLLIMFMIL